jgi:hypothetical protein
VPDPKHVDQRTTGIPHRIDHLGQMTDSSVFDDDAGLRGDIGLDVGISPSDIPGGDGQARDLELSRQGAAFDEKIDLDAWGQDLIEHPDHQLILANRQTPHV